MNDVYKHRMEIADNIIKSFTNDFEKAFPVGTVRIWDGVEYRKVNDNEWVKVKNNKENVAGLSTISRHLKNEQYEKESSLNTLRRNQDDFLKKEFLKEFPELKGRELSLNFKLRFDSFKKEIRDDKYAQQIESLLKEISDISDEIKNIKERSLKLKIENKKEKGYKIISSLEDILPSIPEMGFGYDHYIYDEKGNKIYSGLTPKEALGEKVATSNYYLNTDATFTALTQTSKEADKMFNEMVDSGKFEYTPSPKSSSQYLVDKKNGIIYRYSDHWGKCASCYWDLSYKDIKNPELQYGERHWTLAKCDINDFKRNNGLGREYVNPEYHKIYDRLFNNCLKNVSDFLDRSEKETVFTKNAKKELSNYIKQLSFQAKEEHKVIINSLLERFKKLS